MTFLIQNKDHQKSRLLLNPLSPKSDQNLISPYSNTAKPFIKIMAIKDMIANMRSFDLQMNSSCQYQKKHMRRVWWKWILMSGCKGLISTNSGCSFCHDHVDHITMHSTALTTPPPPLPWLYRTHYLTNREALTMLCSVIKHAGSG